MLGGQSNKGGSQFPISPHPHILRLHCQWCLAEVEGHQWDFTYLEPHHPLSSPVGFVPWDWGNQITGEEPCETQTMHHHHASEKPEKCNTSKKQTNELVIQHHLLENNRKISYQSTRKVPLIHRCRDREGIHQIP